MNLLSILFRIVINWTCKFLVRIFKKLVKEIENDLAEKIAKKVVSSLLRQDRSMNSRVRRLKK